MDMMVSRVEKEVVVVLLAMDGRAITKRSP